MFFIKKDEIISRSNFKVHKEENATLKKYWVSIFEINENGDYILAELNTKKQQEELYDKILQAIYNKDNYVDLRMYEK